MQFNSCILVTGGSGFVGNHLVNYLVSTYQNYFIVNIDMLDYCSTRNTRLEHGYTNYKFIQGNISEHCLVQFILEEYKIDTIIHLAANTHVDNSFGNSLEFTRNNIVGTHTLLECCRIYGKIKKFICMSTDEVLGCANPENGFFNPTNPYAATKAAAEHIVNAYRISFNIPTIIVRCNNIYGPNQYPEKIIPKFIKLLSESKKITIHGDGSNKRKFVHTDDVCSAYDLILHNGIVGEIYGIGTEDEFTNREIADIIIHKMHGPDINPDDFIEYIPDRLFNDTRYWVCIKNLKALGWEPKVKFQDGIMNLIAA